MVIGSIDNQKKEKGLKDFCGAILIDNIYLKEFEVKKNNQSNIR